MASSNPTTFVRTMSLFKNPRPPPLPGASAQNARLLDECSSKNLERERNWSHMIHSSSPRNGALPNDEIPPDSFPGSRTNNPRSNLRAKFRRKHSAKLVKATANCNICKQRNTFAANICTSCEQGDIFSPVDSKMMLLVDHNLSLNTSARYLDTLPVTSTSSGQVSTSHNLAQRRKPVQLANNVEQSSTLLPELALDFRLNLNDRSRRPSLTDPNEPFFRLQLHSQPSTPTGKKFLASSPLTTSAASTRHGSMTSPWSSIRNDSVVCSEASTFPTVGSPGSYSPRLLLAPESPTNLYGVSCALQNTTSVWDDWDSDEDTDKVRLVGWMGRKKNRATQGRDQLTSTESLESIKVTEEKVKYERTREMSVDERLDRARRETLELIRERKAGSNGKRARRSRIMRALSCG